MLSYMLPMEEKPPPIPNKTHLQLDLEHQQQEDTSPLTNGHTKRIIKKCTTISTDSSVSSISSSDVASSTTSHTTVTPTDRPKPKLVVNGTKHPTLKRVSFGSSKGSMVETLIYESPLQEEPEASPVLENVCPFPADGENTESEPSKRVRVTFFESEKPLVVSSPEPSDITDDLDAPGSITMTTPSPVSDHAPPYNRQASTDSGWDNPFRPDGDLSREADEIVEMIKGGKPITPTPGSVAPKLPSVGEDDQVDRHSGASSPVATPDSTVGVATPLSQSPPPQVNQQSSEATKVGANGTAAPCANDKAAAPGAVEVQRATVIVPNDASQVEHVVLKKKSKCKCCVIQ
ncbi:mucin-2 [Anabrus simplex]|uniref:mucin-2 n=1 Tax=Anabrus simplex TaxID=316456 RepID=UPI0035A3B50F